MLTRRKKPVHIEEWKESERSIRIYKKYKLNLRGGLKRRFIDVESEKKEIDTPKRRARLKKKKRN